METPIRKLYLFDDFCLDTTDCQLRRRGEVIALPPKVFDTLRVMVEHRGRILEKEFLMKLLWPDTFVEDGTLAQYVFLLRKALHEETSEQRYIETVPRRGYRFVAQVQEINGDEASAFSPSISAIIAAPPNGVLNGSIGKTNGAVSTLPLATAPAASTTTFFKPVAIIVALLAACLLAAYFFLRRSEQPLAINQTMQITKLTASGKAGLPVLSPDSKYVAYRVDEAGQQSVWMRQLAATNSVQIVPPAEVELIGLSFSPDGNYLYYTIYQRPPIYGALYRVPVLGGGAVKLIDDVDSAITFAPDGKQMAFVRLAPLESESSIIIANADGSQQQKLATRKLPEYFHSTDGLSWSPDGKLIYGSYASGNADLWAMDAEGANQQQLTTDARLDLAPAASADGRAVAFVSNRGGGFSIWRMDADGLNALRLTKGQADHFPNFTPDGKWVFYTASTHEQPTVWKVPATGGDPVQFTQNPSFSPVVSPDGKWVALFIAMPQALLYKLAILPITGGEPVRIFEIVPPDIPVVRWSRDGRLLTYVDTKQGVSNIWGQPMDGGAAQQLTDFKTDRIFRFAWSPDGKTLVCERGFYVNDVVLLSDFLPQ